MVLNRLCVITISPTQEGPTTRIWASSLFPADSLCCPQRPGRSLVPRNMGVGTGLRACPNRRRAPMVPDNHGGLSLRLWFGGRVRKYIKRPAIRTQFLPTVFNRQIYPWMGIPQALAGHRAVQWQIRCGYFNPFAVIRNIAVI